jgi:hypothetical protein
MIPIKYYFISAATLATLGFGIAFLLNKMPPSLETTITTTQASQNAKHCFDTIGPFARNYSSLVDFCTSPYVFQNLNKSELIESYTNANLPK